MAEKHGPLPPEVRCCRVGQSRLFKHNAGIALLPGDADLFFGAGGEWVGRGQQQGLGTEPDLVTEVAKLPPPLGNRSP